MARLSITPPVAKTMTPNVSVNTVEDLNDWSVSVTSSLQGAVPAIANHTVITLHSHQIIVERQDNLYRFLANLENILLVSSSVLLISISASSVLFALSAISTSL